MSPEDRQQWHDDEDALRLAAQESAPGATQTDERAARVVWRDRGEIIEQLIRERDEARAEVGRLRKDLDDWRRGSDLQARRLLYVEPRLTAAEARIKSVEGLADEWERDGEAGERFCALDLRAALASVPAPTDEAGVERPSPSCHDQRCAGMPACLSCVATDEAGA